MRRLSLLLALSFVSGCAYDPAYGDLSCDTEGATRTGQRCEGGVWILDGDVGGVPDMANGGEDQGPPPDDMSTTPPDMAETDMPCSAESDSFFCARLTKDCGSLTAADNCGVARTVDCGMCAADVEACVDNVCALVPETDQELCAANGATCDSITVMDRTGAMRTVSCGTCTAPLQCGAGGTPNTCACANANDAQFCADNGANCGPVTAMDPICMVMRTVNCGTCTAPRTCGGGGTDNVCGCAETDAAFCARAGRNCGPVTAADACGAMRTTNCGSCTLPETCGGGGQAGTCGCTTADACTANAAQCGSVNVSAQCDNIATANCGNCGANGTCGGSNMCNCDGGYAFVGSSCSDVNECMANTDNCDANATCANTPGSFTCTCNNGYTGNGVTCTAVTSGPTVADSTTGISTNSTITTGTITGVDDDLYVAFVSIRTGSRTVDSISGLGLTWQPEERNCNASDQQYLEIWTARGNSSGDGTITVGLNASPYATAVSVYRVTNVPSSGARGVSAIYNRSGQDGDCTNSNPEATYSFSYTPQYSNSLLLAGTAIEEYTHTAGSGWTEEDEVHEAGSMGRDAGLAVMSRSNSATTAVTVTGTMSQAQNWVTGVYEVRGN